MKPAKTLALLGLGYLGYRALESYRRRKAEQQFIAMTQERQAYVEEQMDRLYKQAKWARYFEFRRRLEDYVNESGGDNPYLTDQGLDN